MQSHHPSSAPQEWSSADPMAREHADDAQNGHHSDEAAEHDVALPSLHDFLGQLRATANPSRAHSTHLSDDELRKQAEFESLNYYKQYPDMYMAHVRDSFLSTGDRGSRITSWVRHGRTLPTTSASPFLDEEGAAQDVVDANSNSHERADLMLSFAQHLQQLPRQYNEAERNVALRWLLHVLIAVSVGIMATVVSYAVEFFEKQRSALLRACIHGAPVRLFGYLFGCLAWIGVAVALVAVASSVVVWYEPAAAGGGIPDVMAYLNGVHLRKAMNLRTFLAKAISCVCAVASGLPVGLEAPLIHLGAITGAGVTQGRSRTLGFQTSLFGAFRNNKDRRDFITAGAACGVSVAFGAPIGGLLFVMEEVSSFWDYSASGQIFLATMVCFTVSTMVNSIVEDQRLLGWVSNAAHVLFEVNLTIPLNMVSIVPSLLLGAVLGALAALFTKLNLILIHVRRTHVKPFPMRRLADPVLLAALMAMMTFSFSVSVPCQPVRPIVDVNESIYIWGTEAQARLFNDTCASADNYSPIGSLSMGSGKNVIRHLFSRQTVAEFPAYQLVVYAVFYFLAACAVSGAAVSGGLVVPSLVIGALFGRLYGLVLWYMAAADVGVAGGYRATDAWMDPGVFALIGAGAFLAGTSRMTMSVCVIMVELSSELHYLLPVMVAIVMSKTVADWLCEPLYHQQMRLECVPYLPPHLLRPEFEMLTAADVMAADVVMLRTREKAEVIVRALRQTTHHAFPVVELHPAEDSGHDEALFCAGDTAANASGLHYKFVGLVTREDLQVLLTLPNLHMTHTGASTVPPSPPRVPLGDPESDGFGGRLTPMALSVREMTWAEFNAHKASLFLRVPDRHDWIRRHDPVTARAFPDETATSEGGRSMPARREQSHVSLFALAGRRPRQRVQRSPSSSSPSPFGPHAAIDDDGEDDDASHGEADVALTTAQEALASMPRVLDISLIVNRSPWVIPPFFNLQMAYHTFRSMGLRHMVVVDGDAVCGIITRKDLLLDTLSRRTRELRDRLVSQTEPDDDRRHSRQDDDAGVPVGRPQTRHVATTFTEDSPAPHAQTHGPIAATAAPAVVPPGVATARAAQAPSPSMTRDIMNDLFRDEL